MARLRYIALLLALIAMSACAGPAASVTESGPAGATRDQYDIFCHDAKQVATYYATLPEAWAAAKKTPFEGCYAKERPGANAVQLTADDKKATAVIRNADPDGAKDLAALVGICAEWNESTGNAAHPVYMGRDYIRAALMVCGDSPYAASMQAFLATPETTPTATPTTKTPTPPPASEPEPTVTTPEPTTKVTYRIESDGPIGVITYSNFVNNQMGQEQAADEIAGPVDKTYSFPGNIFDTRGITSLGVSAQAGAGTRSITCRILVNGREVAKQTSTGSYAVVTCSHSA